MRCWSNCPIWGALVIVWWPLSRAWEMLLCVENLDAWPARPGKTLDGWLGFVCHGHKAADRKRSHLIKNPWYLRISSTKNTWQYGYTGSFSRMKLEVTTILQWGFGQHHSRAGPGWCQQKATHPATHMSFWGDSGGVADLTPQPGCHRWQTKV